MVKGKDRVGTKIFFVEGKKNEEKAYNRKRNIIIII